MFSRTRSLTKVHEFETDDFKYYVMKDNSGNNTDFIEFKKEKRLDSFYAVRINTDNFNEMANILKENSSAPEKDIVETDKAILAVSLFKHNIT